MTRDVFGTYIHTYKFHEAVADKVTGIVTGKFPLS
jgi:type I site-specific restriction-modification system R (restriction) subunit